MKIGSQALRFYGGVLGASLALLLPLGGCSKAPDTAREPAKVPRSWIAPAPLAASAEAPSAEAPSAALEASMKTAFLAHTGALEAATRSVAEPTPAATEHGLTPVIPWHLDGMIAGFTLDVGGVFGTLAADGAPSIKVTWQKSQTEPASKKVAPKAHALRFKAKMTEADVTRLLEPAVRTAVASKSISDQRAFRKRLTIEGVKFLSTTRVLNSIPQLRGWHVDGYQLGLFFTASGDLSPSLGVGGGLMIFFDWTVSPEDPSLPVSKLCASE